VSFKLGCSTRIQAAKLNTSLPFRAGAEVQSLLRRHVGPARMGHHKTGIHRSDPAIERAGPVVSKAALTVLFGETGGTPHGYLVGDCSADQWQTLEK